LPGEKHNEINSQRGLGRDHRGFGQVWNRSCRCRHCCTRFAELGVDQLGQQLGLNGHSGLNSSTVIVEQFIKRHWHLGQRFDLDRAPQNRYGFGFGCERVEFGL
jgi:hypothetical protein